MPVCIGPALPLLQTALSLLLGGLLTGTAATMLVANDGAIVGGCRVGP
ncbi:hypothetical protein ACGFI3_44320 [Nonomuraea wenchangensis]